MTFDLTDEREGTSPPMAILRPPGARPPEAAKGQRGTLGEHHRIQQLTAYTTKAHTTRRSTEPLRGPQVDDHSGPPRGATRLTRDDRADRRTLSYFADDTNIALPPGALEWAPTQGP